ncbi:hypothetical protein GH714_010434 [Hevea brasiliensis]|uniref:ARID domain-containing protein n=1 Tax=Hevea brasiliensis TaxID=3981 RepID=A0A6A6MHT6_HEVBR|nr:hypothetical protein GH714_010434 [Hevea brasiliensis]
MKRVIFEREELHSCKLLNAVKRFGGYDKVVKEKEESKFVILGKKISESAKHVLRQLYFDRLCDYEKNYNRLNKEVTKSCKRGVQKDKKYEDKAQISGSKKRRKNHDCEKAKVFNKADKGEEEELDGRCEVQFGYVSGFPLVNYQRPESVEAKAWDEYCGSPWNLNNLPKFKGSMLQAVHHNITGVAVPRLVVYLPMGLDMELDFEKSCYSDLSPNTVLPCRHFSDVEKKSTNSKLTHKDDLLTVKEGFTEIVFHRYHSSSCKTPSRPVILEGNVELKRGSIYQSSREVRK